MAGTAVVGMAWRTRGELELIRRDVGRNAWRDALSRVRSLPRWAAAWEGDEVAYLLGLCEWRAGSRPAAIEAFRGVPEGSRFEAAAAAFLAEDLLMNWRFRAAEDLLLRALKRDGDGWRTLLPMLVRLGRMQARFDEVRAWLRESFERADDPIGVLRQLWILDRGVAPSAGLNENLRQAYAINPNDDRIWLGLGRVAVLEGDFERAAEWLARCREARPDDRPARSAWLELAREAGRAAEVEELLNDGFWAEIEAAEQPAWLAWLARRLDSRREERLALERWLEIEPFNSVALERLGTLAAQAGESALAEELRLRKWKVDDALDRYRTLISGPSDFSALAERVQMARLAEEAGRAFDARCWCTLAGRLNSQVPEIGEITARLDRSQARLMEVAGNFRRTQPAGGLPRNSSKPSPHAARLAFRDDARSAGLDFTFQNGETAIRQIPVTMSGGLALLDYDGDGWLDVYCVQGGPFPPDPSRRAGGDRLFRNRGDGTFEDATEAAGIPRLSRGYGHGVAVGDYDNDGRPDLFITRWRGYALYRNRGDGTFEERTTAAGLDGDRDWPTSAAFADLDNDGDLDLYVCHYLKWDADNPRICREPQTGAYISCSPRIFPALPDHLFRNDGGRFVDITAEAGIRDGDGRGLGVVAADFDGDGWVDLFVSNDQSANYLFRNLGGCRLEEVGHVAGVAGNAEGGYQAGMGVACGDLDNDGRLDLAVTNFYGESTTLYQNLGGAYFSDRTAASGLASASRFLLGFGASFLDADNDGRLDLLTANGHLDQLPGTPHKMPMQLLRGDGTRFQDWTSKAGPALSAARIGRALAIGDLDNDGRVDALVLDHGGPLGYLHNQAAAGGRFISLRLEGTRCNRDAVGARVEITVAGRRRFQWRIGGGSYQSASDPRLHFGLGTASDIERLEVVWPSGCRQQFTNLAVDRGYLIRENESAVSFLAGYSR